jgi:hypothetical protein
MDVTFGEVQAIDAGVWTGPLRAADAKRLPGAPLKIAGPHVVLLQRPTWDGAALKAPFESVSVLALGQGEAAIYLSAEAGARRAAADAIAAAPADATTATAAPITPEIATPAPAREPAPRRPGDSGDDEAFIAGLDEIGSDMVRVGRALLTRIRALHDGALARTAGNHRLFVETPDNFWSVEIQPRRQAIKLVVRTTEEKLQRAGLPYENERPPSYFAMKIHGDGDVENALRFLAVAHARTAAA